MANDPARDAFLQIIEGRIDIGGRFRDLRRVGASGGDGHFSLVFQAKDTLPNRDVAIKVFRPDRVDAYRLACFQREVQVLEGLQGQPDIIGCVSPCSQFVQETKTPEGITLPLTFAFYAVELAATDVRQIIEDGAWTVEQRLQSFHEMCRAVQRIHALGIAHRDLKPNNFLVMEDRAVKLSDFGAARQIKGPVPPILPRYLMVPGDTRYASPEMIALLHDEDPNFAFLADFYSLGCILFELLTGGCLGLVLDPSFRADLAQVMGNVAQGGRRKVFDALIAQIADSHPLPKLAASGACLPPSVSERVEELYKSMAALAYDARLVDFNRIFLAIRTCLIILRNDAKYRTWRSNRDQYRRNREEKQRRTQERQWAQKKEH